MSQRFRFVRDDDCHNYIIPADKAQEWDDLIYGPEENLWANWPDWAERIDGVNSYSFLDPSDLEEPHKVVLTKQEYRELLLADRELSALYQAGVDNWEGFDYSRDILHGRE